MIGIRQPFNTDMLRLFTTCVKKINFQLFALVAESLSHIALYAHAATLVKLPPTMESWLRH